MSASPDQAAQLDAAHQADVCAQWRDWHRYLTAHTTLLAAQTADIASGPRFEQASDDWDAKRTQAEADLKRIGGKRRALFDAVREQRRLEVYAELEQAQRENPGGAHTAVVDAHAVDTHTMQGLLDDAEGRGAHAPNGLVPWTHGRWYQVDLQSVRGAPTAADYSVDAIGSVDKRKRMLLIVGILVVMVVSVWLTWPRGRGATNGDQTRVRVNGVAGLLWTPRELLITDRRGTVQTHVITATTTVLTEAPASGALWLRDRPRPLTLCLSGDVQQTATSIRVRSSGDMPERVYSLYDPATAATGTTPDLVVLACGVADSSRPGILSATQPMTDVALGTAFDLGDGRSSTVTSITVEGPAQDQTIPAGQVRVVVAVHAPSDVDWSQFAPTLITAGGASLLPAETTARDGNTAFLYLAPSWQGPSDVAWMITSHDALRSARWRVTLDPPLTRLALLRAALDIADVQARPIAGGDGLELHVTLHNTGSAALQLHESDIQATQGNSPLLFAPFAALRTALGPGETRPLTVVLPAWDATSEPIELTVGVERFRLRSNTTKSTAVREGR